MTVRQAKKGKSVWKCIMWGIIYSLIFIGAFLIGIFSKIAIDPSHGAYKAQISDIGNIVSDIAYGNGEANKFDLYLPKDNSRKTYSMVVYLHAGGFTSGDKRDDQNMLMWLAKQGYVAVGINYTLRDQTNNASVYSQSLEIKQAMSTVVETSASYGYPIGDMAIGGGSAGGCLALIYAYRDALSAPVPLKFVFSAAGPAGFHVEDWDVYGLNQSNTAASAMFSVISGLSISEQMIADGSYLEMVKPISADMWVNEHSVPTLLIYGKKDKIQPYAAAVSLDQTLTKYGVDHDFYVAEHSGHGLQNDNTVYKAYMDKLIEYLKRYLEYGESR